MILVQPKYMLLVSSNMYSVFNVGVNSLEAPLPSILLPPVDVLKDL